VPTHLLLFALVTVLAPVWLVIGGLIDLVRWLAAAAPGGADLRLRVVVSLIGALCLLRLLGHWFAGFRPRQTRCAGFVPSAGVGDACSRGGADLQAHREVGGIDEVAPGRSS
jgi:hypothetical protein